ncbi:hypothetical protein EZS27_003874 [termite gut metagenome]|uniref:Helix-turn-helix domain-containing protein n=1 Tax=termite gut metagenome TaxID=433724 RepID=A0A5J4STA4_9ZZZZ
MSKFKFEGLSNAERLTLLSAKSMFSFDEAAWFIGVSASHLYKLTSSHQISFYKPHGKLIYFDRKDLEAWMRQGRTSTTEEIEQAATNYVVTGKVGGR